jgi:hypothetical protein
MIISDLNHLEVVNQDTNIIGGISNLYAATYLDFFETVDVLKRFDVKSKVEGNSAFAEGDAEAYGYDSHAESLTYTVTDDYYSASTATSISQSN